MSDNSKLRILIVEDNPDHALIIEREFKKFFTDVEVECAENGEDCLEKLAWQDYSAVILDYSLPKMNGLDVLIKIFEDCFDVPVIMVSGHGNENIAASAIKKGAFDYIVKGPDYASHLINTVISAVDKHKLRRELQKKDDELKSKDEELSKREEELQALDMMKSAMLTSMIHSLRTPLVSIRGYSELIMNGELGPVTEEQKNGLSISIRNVDKILQYIENYFIFGSDSEGVGLNISNICLNQILEDSITTLLPNAINKKIKISMDSIDNIFYIKGDERRIFQAFVNLIEVFLLATPSKGLIKVKIENDNTENISVHIESSSILEGLENNPKLENIRKSIKQNLSIAEELVVFHNGKLIENDDFNLFSVTILLPIESVQKLDTKEIIKSEKSLKKRGTILIVDDDKDCLDLLSMIFAKDYNTISIKAGKKIFDVLNNNDVDLILLDINMYDINGIDACREIKSNPKFSNIPVYMISATLGEDKKQLSLDAGASGFIEKPFEMDTILRFVESIFKK